MFLGDRNDLVMDVTPLPHPIEGEEMGAAEFFQAAGAWRIAKGVVTAVPDINEGYKIRIAVLKNLPGPVQRPVPDRSVVGVGLADSERQR